MAKADLYFWWNHMFFSQSSCCHGWNRIKKKKTLTVEVDGVSSQSCFWDPVLITALFLQSAEHKRAPRKY